MFRISMLALAATLLLQPAQAQSKLTEIWHSEATLPTPESVLYDEDKDMLYVSCIDGQPDGKDGKGAIAVLSKDGKIVNPAWVTGLSAPKGMAKVGNLLYVSDISDIVIIDIAKGAIAKRIVVEGAKFLNDFTADAEGNAYVSDMRTGKIHRLKNGKVETYLEGLKGPNGLHFANGSLYVLASGKLLQFGTDKQPKTLAEGMDESSDGLVMPAPGEFIASSWMGAVYHIHDSHTHLMLDTREQKSQTADIGYNPKTKVVYVPTFTKNSVVAYQLN